MTPAIFFLTFSFKVIGINCATCAPPAQRALAAVPGVKDAEVDKNDIATVDIPANFDRNKLREALSHAGYDAEFPGEHRPDLFIAPPPAEAMKSFDIVSFDGRSRVDFEKILAPGKATILDFYADWCAPCHALEARIERYMQGHPNVALRRLNVGTWNNVAAHQAADLGATALPYLRVYDKHGKLTAAVSGGDWGELLAAVEKAPH